MPDASAQQHQAPPQPLSVSLVLDEAMFSALRADIAVSDMLDSYTLDSPAMAEIANSDMRKSIDRVREIKAWKAKFVEPAKTIIVNAEALFDPSIEAHDKFVAGMRAKLLSYTQGQQRLADEARRKREDDERAARQRADAAAAAARAKADEEAATKRREAEEAEKRRLAAVAAGDSKAAAQAATQAAKAEERAAAIVENAEVKVAEIITTAVATAPEPVAAPARVAGFGLRDNWKANLAPGKSEADALELMVAAIAGVEVDKLVRRELLSLLKRDASACDRLAKALKDAMNVPGLRAANEQTSVSRKA